MVRSAVLLREVYLKSHMYWAAVLDSVSSLMWFEMRLYFHLTLLFIQPELETNIHRFVPKFVLRSQSDDRPWFCFALLLRRITRCIQEIYGQ